MAKKSNFIKNLLTTASAVAVIAGGASSAYAGAGAGFSRANTLDADFGAGANFLNDNAAANAAVFINNNNFINAPVVAVGAGVELRLTGADINVASFDVYGNDAKITVDSKTLTLGAVYNSAKDNGHKALSAAQVAGISANNANIGGNPNAKLNLVLTNNAASIITLTGTAAANGGVSPATMGAVANLYTSLGVIDFNNGAGTLIANAANNGTIILEGASVIKADTGGKLQVVESLTVDHASFATIKNIQIAAGKVLTFNVATDIKNVAGAEYNFGDNASSIIFNVDATGGKKIELYANLVKTAGPADDTGVIKFNSTAARKTLTVTGNAGHKTIGTDNANRFTTIEFNGAGDVLLDANVTPFAKNIVHSGAGNVTITNVADTGANGDVSVTGAGELKFLAAVTANKATVNNGGTLTLSANSTITTTNITKGKLDAANAVLTGKLNLGDLAHASKAFATVKEITGDTKVEHGATLDVTDKITGTLNVDTGARVNAENADVTGLVTINTNNTGINTIKNANNGVTVTAGKLTMNDITAGDLTANSGETTVHNIAGKATLNNGAIVNVSGNINGDLDLAANTGFVKFSGDGAVTGAVGATKAITKITVEDTTTFANAAFKVAELNFAETGAKAVFNQLVDFTDANMAKVTLSKGSKDNIIQINKNAPITIEGEINKDGDVNALTFLYNSAAAGQKTLIVDTNNFKASVKSRNDKRLNLEFSANTAGTVGSLGDKNNLLNEVTFKSPNNLSVGDIYAAKIVINDASQTTFRGIVSSELLTLGSAGAGTAVARFANGAEISSPITTDTLGENRADFEGNVTINKPITDLERVTFSKSQSKAYLNADITVGTVLAQETVLLANNNNVTISSATTAKYIGAAAGKTLTFKNNNGVPRVAALTLEDDVIISTEINGTTAGKVVVEGGALDMSRMNSATVGVNEEHSKVALGTKFTVFDSQGMGADLTDSVSKEAKNDKKDSAYKWVVTSDQNKVYLTAGSNLEELSKSLPGADATDKSNFQALGKDPKIFEEIREMTQESRTELVQRMDPTDATAVVSDITTGVSAGLGSRITNLIAGQSSSVQNKVVASNGTTGLSSGDDEARYGVWISPFFNQSVQKSNKGSAGYDASTGGGSFGFDTKANDDMVVGLALSMIHSDVKYKNYKSGDKNKINSAMFSVYGMQQITDNWFAQGLVTVGTSKVSTNEKRKTGNTNPYQNATGTYNSMSFSGEALVGYNYSMNDFSITPMGGLRLTRVNDDGYTETGTTNQNLSITKKALSKAEIVVGTRVAGPAYDLNGVSVTPEVHGFLNQDMVGKNAKVNIKTSNGVQIADKSSKPNKTSFNVGAGLDAKYSYMEYGIAYDANISKKFMSNQGTIKVRLNF